MKDRQYWLVGADWTNGDNRDRCKEFVECGIWVLGWQDTPKDGWPALCNLAKRMKAGDAIAIIKWCGGADAAKTRVKAIGKTKGVLNDDMHKLVICGVDWIAYDETGIRLVPHKGNRNAVCGPFNRNNEPEAGWINSIFSI